MTKPFHNLDEGKQQRIINAAFNEFARRGFEQASTNQIVKAAGIGKGMLFYYFNSKKELYTYLIDYCMDMTEQYLNRVNLAERDMITKLKQVALLKAEFLAANPAAMDFLASVLFENSEEIDPNLKLRIQNFEEKGYSMIFENMDYSLIRKDIDPAKAVDLIRWAIHGYGEEMKLRFQGQELDSQDYGRLFKEFDDYLDILRASFYETKEG